MNSISKKELIDRISAKLKTQQKEKFVVGGNKHTYQKRYHLTITKAIIAKVLDVFLNVVVDAISNGNKIQIYGYFTIYPQHYKERTVNMFDGTSGHISPEHYKLKINAGKNLKEACRILNTEKKIPDDFQPDPPSDIFHETFAFGNKKDEVQNEQY